MTDRVIHGANWYINDVDQAHRLAECGLPDLRQNGEEMVTGGGFFAFSVPTEIAALTFEFSIHGAHEAIRARFGREAGDWTQFTYYERTRDLETGVNFGRVVMIKGLINEVRHPRIVGKRPGVTRYGGGSVWEYLDMVDGRVIHRFDFKRNILVIDGVDYTGEANRIIART